MTRAAYAATTDDVTWRGLAGASASGAVAGAVGAVAGPLAGTVARGVGATAGGALATGLAGGINFGVGAGLDLPRWRAGRLRRQCPGRAGGRRGRRGRRSLPADAQPELAAPGRPASAHARAVPGVNRTISAFYGNTALGGALGGLVGAVPSFFDPARTGGVRK